MRADIVHLGISVPRALHERVEQELLLMAEENPGVVGISKSALARLALQEFLDRRQAQRDGGTV